MYSHFFSRDQNNLYSFFNILNVGGGGWKNVATCTHLLHNNRFFCQISENYYVNIEMWTFYAKYAFLGRRGRTNRINSTQIWPNMSLLPPASHSCKLAEGGLATVWTSLPPFHLISNLSSLELYSFDGTQRRKLGKGFREWFANSCVCSVSWVGLAAKPWWLEPLERAVHSRGK